MTRFPLSFAIGACLAALAIQGCSKSSSSGSSTATLRVGFDAQPTTGLPGEPLAIRVSLRRADGQVAAAATSSVTLSLASNPAQASLSGTTTRPVVNGVATFDDVSIPAAGRGYTLTAAATNGDTATSRPFDLAFSTSEAEQAGSSSNDELSGAEPIFSGVPVTGSLSSADDVDVYTFHAEAGQLLSVSSYATRYDLAGWDSSLLVRLLGPDGAELQRIGSAELDRFSMDHGLARVRIPADGDYYLSCEIDGGGLAAGKYALVMRLGAAPPDLQVDQEQAPHGDRASARPLAPGVLHARYAGGPKTDDFYRIGVASPTRVKVQLSAFRNGVAGNPALGTVAWDGELQLQDSAGRVLWTNDDTWFYDPCIDYVVVVPGDYFVVVKRYPADQGSSPYLLSYEALPYSATPAAPGATVTYGQYVSGSFEGPNEGHEFRFVGSKGDMVRAWILDATHLQGSPVTIDASSAGTQFVGAATGLSVYASFPPYDSNVNTMQTILQSDGEHGVRLTNGAVPGPYAFLLERVAAAGYESEPNGTPASANAFGPTGWISGAIGTVGDTDAYALQAEAGQLVSVSLFAGSSSDNGGPYSDWGASAAFAPRLRVVDAQGAVLAETSLGRTGAGNFAESVLRPDSTLEVSFRAPAAATFFVLVSDANGAGGADFFYALRLLKNQ